MRFSLLIPILTLVTCQPRDSDPFTECLVPDLNLACTNRCEAISLECFANCAADDSACWSECLRENSACFNDCPCELNCLDGCDDCDNPVCDCHVVEENPDWNRCIDDNSIMLGRCVHACNDDQGCEDDCLNRFKTRQLNCPCEENCSAGCPCSEFDCIATTPAPDMTTITDPATTTSPTGNAVLVLSTYNNANKPMIVDFNGNINEDLTFEYGDGTQTYNGCAATFQNEFWYFGGNERQASKIVGCKLERQTDMIFDFNHGACNTFDQPNQIVLLCFDYIHVNECHTFDGNLFQSAGSSSHSHDFTYGIANYKGKAFTTGCWNWSGCYVKTELMDMNTLTWSSGPVYPFTSKAMIAYSTASTSEAVYIIGGQNTKEIIARYDARYGWLQVGTMTQGRHYHGSISLDDEVMVLGGFGSDTSDLKTEIWNLGLFETEDNKVIDPALHHGHYIYGVGLYLVPFNFCTF